MKNENKCNVFILYLNCYRDICNQQSTISLFV